MIRTNSKEINQGDIFIAIKGERYDGHNFIEEAIKNGASKVVVEHGTYEVETIKVNDTKLYLNNFVKEYYLPRIKDLKLIGVTGTNGKTTSCFLLYQMLNKFNMPCAYIGTIGFYLKDNVKILRNTTPDILSLYQMLYECKINGMDYVAMEVSSHSLAQSRIAGLTFDYAIYTNLTQDHLDFHKDMNEYALTKQKLFKLLTSNGKAIINNDDKYSDQMKLNNYLTYGFTKSDYQVLKHRLENDHTSFILKHNDVEYNIISPLFGTYNIYNLLTMIIVLHQEGIKMTDIINKILLLKAPAGRMETIIYNNNKIIIDYAHTPDAVFNILNAVREFSNGKIYSIIGCGGNRDKTKRPKMAFYAMAMSDQVIITNDNPRFENPDDIIRDMLHNNTKQNYEVIKDRGHAIERGIEMLSENDALVILGKGHEDYQIINDEKRHHSDLEYVLKICRG